MREFLLIRHAPVATSGRLMGRSDWPAEVPNTAPTGSDRLGAVTHRFCSPALRCVQTASWLGGDWQHKPLLWEQDFGDWEGKPYTELPDLGHQTRLELAQHRPPRGESFLDLCARYERALAQMPATGTIAILAHAGIIRAALGLALGTPEAGLTFNIEPLSLTRLSQVSGGWAISGVGMQVFGAYP